jgi:hypothetical protein
MWLLLLPVFLKLEIILQTWLVEVPEYTALFCRLMLIQSLISSTQRPFVMAIFATGKMKLVNLTSGTVLLLVLPVSYLLLKMGNAVYCPFIVYIVAFIITSFIELCFLHKWIKLPIMHLIRETYLPIILIGACTLPISLFANYYSKDNIISLVWVSAISMLLVIISTYYIAFSRDMRNRVLKKIGLVNKW